MTFGGASASAVTVVSANQITATTPSGFGTVPITVRNPDGQSGTLAGAYTYFSAPAPNVTAVSPPSGPVGGGNTVTIYGTGFLPGAVARFGGVTAPQTVVLGSTQIQAVVPASTFTGSVSVRVTNTDGKTDVLTSAYTYVGTPSITAVAPAFGSALGGTLVTITGANFAAGATVTFGGIGSPSVTVESSTRIVAQAPAQPEGTVSVAVQNPDGQTATLVSAFTYRVPPNVSALSPSSGPTSGGTLVAIFGANFTGGMTVRFGGTTASGVVLISANELRAVSPAHPSGAVQVTVTTAEGVQASGAPTFVYFSVVQPGGIITGAIPASGFGIIVVQAGTVQQLVSRSGCTASTLAYWVTNSTGAFVIYLPRTAVGAVNEEFFRMFPGGVLPANTVMIARCT